VAFGVVAALLAGVWVACLAPTAAGQNAAVSSPGTESNPVPARTEPPRFPAPKTQAADAAANESDTVQYEEDRSLLPPRSFRQVWVAIENGDQVKIRLLWDVSMSDRAPEARTDEELRAGSLFEKLSREQKKAIRKQEAADAAHYTGKYVLRRKLSSEPAYAWEAPPIPSEKPGEEPKPDEDFPAPEKLPAGTRQYTDDRFQFLVPFGEDAELKQDEPKTIEELQPIRERKRALDPRFQTYDYELRYVEGNRMSPPVVLEGIRPITCYFATTWTNVLIVVLVGGGLVIGGIALARGGRQLYVRPIAGLQAVDDAVGRATEMGRPVLFCAGFGGVDSISTIAAMVVLGRIARIAAEHGTEIIVPCLDPVVMTALREVVREAYLAAGRPDAYQEDRIYYLTSQQFAYAAGLSGIMTREKTAANFYMGYFFAEALILAESGFLAGSIQIAGTDATTQLPFFITACDYTLMGEEFYGASAYLSREPKLLGSLKGQDLGKLIIATAMTVAALFATGFAVMQATGAAEYVKELFHFKPGG
jgi:hypothetical protein